jgi:hypothetical protein
MQYDVFNGDADGICALHQLRLAHPIPDVELVTGVKRDINLLRRIEDVQSSSITVLDVSLDTNRDALLKMLQNDNRFLYIDHHFAGDIPDSRMIDCHIEPSAETCTSLIVNSMLQGKYKKWAVCGAFGDNLHDAAYSLVGETELDAEQIEILRDIGELFNYNGYGAKIEDLHIHPAELYNAIMHFEDPLEFYNATDIVKQLKSGYKSDMTKAMDQENISAQGPNRVYKFPAAPWARRTTGVFSNLKARQKKNAAHAVIVENDDASLQISVRAPLLARKNADILCRQFPTGGGRAAAAGINNLPQEMLDDFLLAFHRLYN